MPPPIAESANAALCAWSRDFGGADQLVPLGIRHEGDLLAERGARDRAGPVRTLSADVGRRRHSGERGGVRRPVAAEVEEVCALTCGEHALDHRTGGDAERLAVLARLRTLRHLAGALLRRRVGDVADALPRDRR